jgi:hypothetical protein
MTEEDQWFLFFYVICISSCSVIGSLIGLVIGSCILAVLFFVFKVLG